MRRAGRRADVPRFTRQEGDAHCQVSNLPLAQAVVLDRLDEVLERRMGQ
ncbi:hypothetical protein I6B53_04710 [Schaalia sp. 19OD2882]|nr:hypothetical protein [Schaalia sp. 19OD2882]QWW20385.1 hypothetical protein I6B53_04710 [Schaalia sp. 19OD2882]